MDTVIYGAQGVAFAAYNAIREIQPDRKIVCFLVTEMGKNPKELAGIPVRELKEFVSGMTDGDKDGIEVLIGTTENQMAAIEKSLTLAGLNHFVRLDSARWADMQKMAFMKNGRFTPLELYPTGHSMARLHVYKMVSHKDKLLQMQYTDPEYMTAVQVGAAVTDDRIAVMSDNVGDSISERNGNYSELTGLYWMWKNVVQKDEMPDISYYGMAHYRRILDLTDEELMKLPDNGVDVVLPYPMTYWPDMEKHHERYLSEGEWSAVLQALDELCPEYAASFKKILKQEYMYNYNVIIAKGTVLDEYCRWLFPILFRVEEIKELRWGSMEADRFIGYVGESLETLYFMHNKDKLRIAHTGVRFRL